MGQLEVYEFLRDHGPASVDAIVTATGWKRETVRSNLHHLKRYGDVRQVGIAPYTAGINRTVPVWGAVGEKDDPPIR